MIDRELEAKILRLFEVEKWPPHTIAGQLGVHHDVVRRVLDQAGTPTVRPARPCMIDDYVPFIREVWRRYPRLPASRLYRMCKERGYAGRPDHFRHMASRYRPARPVEAFLRLKTLPGEQAQVDWAHFGKIEVGQAQRSLVAFVLVLSWSRAIFLRFFPGQQTENFLRGHHEAFERFGGVVRVCLYDNLKSAVLERIGDAIRFNPLIVDFAAHYRYEPRPVAVARGNEKGRVERAIRYVRTDFFLGRRWRDLDDLNRQADAWCRGEALQRRWREDPKITVGDALDQERGTLLPLPQDPFPTDERREVVVGKTPYLRFDGNDYSVPHERVRRTLTVLASLTEVRILDGAREVARHPRSFDRHRQIEDAAHIEALVAHKRRARKHRGLDRLAHAVPACRTLMERLAERGANLGGATARLLLHLDTYGAEALDRAVREVLERNAPHLAAVRQVLERNHAARGKPPALALPLPDDPRVRDLCVRPHDLGGYDGIARDDDEEGDDDGQPQGALSAG